MDWAPKRPVPVFPLPGVVLFPHAEMSLHVLAYNFKRLIRILGTQRVIRAMRA